MLTILVVCMVELSVLYKEQEGFAISVGDLFLWGQVTLKLLASADDDAGLTER